MSDTLADFVLKCSGNVSDEDVQSMLCSGSDIDAFAICCTALGWAARYGNGRLVATLLRHGASIEVGYYDECVGWNLSPLYLAIQNRHTHVAQLLIDAGANINLQSTGGHSILHCAIASDSKGCLALLAKAGIDLNGNRGDCLSALNVDESDNFECLPLLLALGVTRTMPECHGYRFLQSAVGRGAYRTVRLLVAASFPIEEPELTDNLLRSCVLPSVVHEPLMQMLVDAGANLLVALPLNKTALEIVERKVQRHVFKKLKAATRRSSEECASARSQFFESLDVERRMIARARLDLIRQRTSEICIGLQALELPAWVTIQILEQACRFQSLVPLHSKWNLVTAIKHFKYTSDAD